MSSLRNLVVRLLRDVANKIDAGTSEISDAEAVDIVNMMTHRPMSKEMSCKYLNLSRSRFDDLIREKKFPKGRKRMGFKELVWWQDELNDCVENLKK